MNKICFTTYLSSDKDSLIVSDSEIKGVHGLPLGINPLLGQFKRVIKTVKCMVPWLASTATEDHCYMPVAWHI